MQKSERKVKIISLRLSDEEYESLKAQYTAHGAKSLSDFARTAMQRLIAASGDEPHSIEMKVRQMDGLLASLGGEVTRLTQLVEGELAPRAKNGNDQL
jgi:hypothetical protein